MLKATGPLKPIVTFVFFALIFLSLARLGFMTWQWQRVSDVHGFWFIFFQGIRVDLATLSWGLMVPAIISVSLPNITSLQKNWSYILSFILVILAAALICMEVATPFYIDEYGTRPSRVFIEYLIYPREVMSTVWSLFKVELLLAIPLIITACVLFFRYILSVSQNKSLWSWRQRLAVLPLLVLVLVMGARSSLSHRPINVSSVVFCNDVLMNQLPLNSTYSLAYAVLNMKNEADAGYLYGTMPKHDIIQQVVKHTLISSNQFKDPDNSTIHQQIPSVSTERPHNVVIILSESLGAQFVASLGGKALTPELEKLKHKGLWFTQLYATGTRSVRGIEAVVTGFPPTPARSVVKLGLAQRDFYTLAQTFKQTGYSTEFIYGGDSHFDNMANFFLSNGFDRLIDETHFSHPTFHGTWGVSDEDLFERVHQTLLAHKKPFFTVVFTTSFHTPYEFPSGRVDEEVDHNRSFAAVRYADYALGKFFKQAMQAPYWDNTIFLFIADHDQRVFGYDLVPIEHFHIPALILGGSIKPKFINAISSQIDMPVTLLSLAGVHNTNPMIGRDLSHIGDDYVGRAIMQYENNHGYYENGMLVVHSPKLPARQFHYQQKRLVPVKVDKELEKIALAHVLWASLTYKHRQYTKPTAP